MLDHDFSFVPADGSRPCVPGCHARYLRIDLTRGRAEAVAIPEAVLRQFLGGSGLGAWLMLCAGAEALDPLDPASPLAFVFSPLVGSPLTTSAKFAVVAKSPLTERFNDSLVSSQFAIAGKRSGYDAIVLVGQSPRLSAVIVDEDRVRVEPADAWRGATAAQVEADLRVQLGPDYALAAIGPAGERRVPFATVSHDGRHAGRGGHGAVLGSKNVKALAVRGERRCEWARPDDLFRASKELSRRSFGPATAKYRELGTAANLLLFNRLGSLPTRNFRRGTFDGAVAVSPEQLATTRDKTRKSCAACTIGCEHLYSLSPGAGGAGGQGTSGGPVRLEYENLFALGPLCGIDDPQTVLAASRRCDELGIDTISAGGVIAFAMECAGGGMLDAPWLRFGDGAALLRALEEIGHGVGLGNWLAEGSRRLAMRIGQGAIDFAPQVKGLEIPGYEPRALQTMALGFAVGTRGADHNRSGAYEVDFSPHVDRHNPGVEGARLAVETEDRAAIFDSLVLCKFLRGVFGEPFAELSELLGLATGWDVSADELRQTARRIVAAKKLFNVRAGWRPQEDTLPARFFDQALPDDPAARLSRAEFAAMVAAYNQARGWTADGHLPSDELARLGLADV